MSRQPPRPDSGLYQDWKSWANALLRYLQLVGEESLLEAGTQVKTYVSTDVPSAEQAGQLIYQTDTLKMSASFSDVWNDFAFLSVANTWTQIQTITGSTSNFTALHLISTSDDANAGPYILMNRASPSAAAADGMGGLIFRGRNSTPATFDYGIYYGVLLDPTAGNEDFQHTWFGAVAGVSTNLMRLADGAVLGTPSSGLFKGVGSLHMAGALWRDNLQLLSTRKTGWAVDTGTAKRTANVTYTGTAEAGYTQATVQTLMDAVRDLSQTVKALKDDLHATAGHGLIGT